MCWLLMTQLAHVDHPIDLSWLPLHPACTCSGGINFHPYVKRLGDRIYAQMPQVNSLPCCAVMRQLASHPTTMIRAAAAWQLS